MDYEIDTGEIIEVTRFPASYEMETAQSLERKCQKFIFEQFTGVVDRAFVKKVG